jgi:tripartite-type tricarboxylate transporter receptor subunit TctC
MQWFQLHRLAIALAASIFVAISAPAAWAQAGRTIRLILPFPPGGPADAMARIVAQQIGAGGGPTFVVESHPGAGTEIGTELVARLPTATRSRSFQTRSWCCRIFASSTTTR